ncbi:hypothetical protein AAFC00_001794 [Neodothiora populina]
MSTTEAANSFGSNEGNEADRRSNSQGIPDSFFTDDDLRRTDETFPQYLSPAVSVDSHAIATEETLDEAARHLTPSLGSTLSGSYLDQMSRPTSSRIDLPPSVLHDPSTHPDTATDAHFARWDGSLPQPRPSSARRIADDTARYQHTDNFIESQVDEVPDVMSFLERWEMHMDGPGAGMIDLRPDCINNWRPRSEDSAYETHDFRDIQGLGWESLGTDRKSASRVRSMFYPPEVSYGGPLQPSESAKPDHENFYSFKRAFHDHKVRFTHYQLRHTLAATSRNDVFYASCSKVKRASLSCPTVADTIIDLSSSSRRCHRSPVDCHITTIAASPAPEFPGYTSDSVLVTGSFEGEYSYLDLNSSYGQLPTEGHVTKAADGITTHIHAVRNRRSGTLAAAFCSNDRHLRLLDLRTDTWLSSFSYPDQLNCAATSPDGRLRVVVGDTRETLITDAERGDVLISLQNHSDDAFACAWADDGWHVATGAQDGKVVICDARNWKTPLATLHCDVGCARSLLFTRESPSPSSSSPALVVAEAYDVVSVYDTRDWATKQTINFFGSVSGVASVDNGRELIVGVGDRTVGGLLLFERNEDGFVVAEQNRRRSSAAQNGLLRASRKRNTDGMESYWENQPKRLGLVMEQLII